MSPAIWFGTIPYQSLCTRQGWIVPTALSQKFSMLWPIITPSLTLHVKGGQGDSLFRWDVLLLKKVSHSIESLCRVCTQIARKSHLYSLYIRKTNCGVTLSPSIEAVEEDHLSAELVADQSIWWPEPLISHIQLWLFLLFNALRELLLPSSISSSFRVCFTLCNLSIAAWASTLAATSGGKCLHSHHARILIACQSSSCWSPLIQIPINENQMD